MQIKKLNMCSATRVVRACVRACERSKSERMRACLLDNSSVRCDACRACDRAVETA